MSAWLVCFRDKKLMSDEYEKTGEGGDAQGDVNSAADDDDIQSSDADGLLVRPDLHDSDGEPLHPGTNHRLHLNRL